MAFGLSEENDTTENHVYAGGEDGGCSQEAQSLRDVGAEAVFVGVREGAADVADPFNWDCQRSRSEEK